MFNRTDRFIFSGVVVGTILNYTTNILSNQLAITPAWQKNILYILLSLIICWTAYKIVYFVAGAITSGRYAVEAFILNDNNDLLLYRHPYHKKNIPPGGRVGIFDYPHNAITHHLEERLGLKRDSYIFAPKFHHGLRNSVGDLDHVDRVPAPFLVQRELRRQRSFVKFHYDFIYVIQLTNQNITFTDSHYSPVYFVSYDDLEQIVRDHRSFPDVLNIYKMILSTLNATGKTS